MHHIKGTQDEEKSDSLLKHQASAYSKHGFNAMQDQN